MNKNTPLAEFCIECDSPVYFRRLCDDIRLFPYEMKRDCDGWMLIEMFKERTTPPTRIGLLDKLREIGMDGYDISKLIVHQNGTAWDDPFWVKFEDGPKTWEEVRTLIGFEV